MVPLLGLFLSGVSFIDGKLELFASGGDVGVSFVLIRTYFLLIESFKVAGIKGKFIYSSAYC